MRASNLKLFPGARHLTLACTDFRGSATQTPVTVGLDTQPEPALASTGAKQKAPLS